MSLLDAYRTPAQVAARPKAAFARLGNGGVGHSKDLARIKALPSRPLPSDAELEALASAYTESLSFENPNCVCQSKFGRPCVTRLRPVQGWALHEISDPQLRAGRAAGLFGAITVGGGKSLLYLLSVWVVPDCESAVLFVPANLRAQMIEIDIEYYSQHWRLPNVAEGRYQLPNMPTLHVVSYSQLSSAKSTDLLDRLQPDLIICDEAHSLKDKKASRSRRFLRYFKAHPKTRLLAWSGTLMSKSIRDYAHLTALALGEGSPLPLSTGEVEEWARALDPSEMPADPGALLELGPGDAMGAFSHRLVHTKGVIHTSATDGCDASLILQRRTPPPTPQSVQKLLTEKDAGWTRPDGEQMTDVLSRAALLRQLSYGFYYRWIYPRGEEPALIDAWFQARQDWNRELRAKLKYPRVFLDSPLLCTKAAQRFERGETATADRPTWHAQSWTAWRDIRDKVEPTTETVWIDTWLAEDAARWANETVGIVWYTLASFGRKVAEIGNLAHFGGGEEASRTILQERATRSIVASIASHGTGKNLQVFNRALVANLPTAGQVWEQLLGRLHRPGQTADEVVWDVYQHTDTLCDAFEAAGAQALAVEQTMRTPQKLCLATKIGL